MTENDRIVLQHPSAIGGWWHSFWFQCEPMYTLGLVRMAFGVLAVLWTIWLLPVLNDLLGPDGVVPTQPPMPYMWGIFELWSSSQAIFLGWAVLLVASIALTVGWHSRLAAVLVFILILSFQRRDPWVFNAGDVVVRIEALLLALSPCGAALSLDQRRKSGSFWSAESRPVWPVRLLQVQMSIIYLAAFQTKLSGETWLQGTAVSYTLRLDDMQRWPAPDWFTTNALMMNLVTWGTLAIELALAVLIWNRRFRSWVLVAGVVLHLIIDAHILIGIFSYAMLVLYLAWVSPETVAQLRDKFKCMATKSWVPVRRRRLRESTTQPPPRRDRRADAKTEPPSDTVQSLKPRPDPEVNTSAPR
jgi:vitamin K-dependent gamma-carboxylase-like protein